MSYTGVRGAGKRKRRLAGQRFSKKPGSHPILNEEKPQEILKKSERKRQQPDSVRRNPVRIRIQQSEKLNRKMPQDHRHRGLRKVLLRKQTSRHRDRVSQPSISLTALLEQAQATGPLGRYSPALQSSNASHSLECHSKNMPAGKFYL